jgi:exopolyphosphatase/guanosine-5'-triphosphate,3'-diphosphate pyrophosphatase
MRLGVIDLGANSVHLAVIQVWEDLTYTFLHQDRTQVRLGAPVFDHGAIDPQTESKTVATLRKFLASCRNHEVDVLLAVATSALREAANSTEVIERIKNEVGIEVEVISGREEARLTALAAASSLGLVQGKVLVMDVGGGSTELAWLEDNVPQHLWSFHLGTVRILEQVQLEDPPGAAGLEELRSISRKSLAPVFRAKLGLPDETIATSGTAVCLGELCGTADRAVTALETRIVLRASLKNLLERLAEMPLEKRREWLGRFADRADTLISGGMILLTAMEDLGLDKMVTGGKALRTGIVLDYLEREIYSTAKDRSHRLAQMARQGSLQGDAHDIRAQNILKLARRYEYEPEHCNKVLELVTLLFEGFKAVYYWLGEEDCFYLESAALLHDIGYYINTTKHHHHSQYLVLNSDIEGFHQMEIRTIANLVRYHSREMPGSDNPDYATLPEGMKKKVDVLAGILRVADALDVTHQGLVQDVKVEVGKEKIRLVVAASGPIDLEIQEVRAKGKLLSKALGLELEVVAEPG